MNDSMAATIEETAVQRKTRELCQAILEEPGMPAIRERIDAFMADNVSRDQYEALITKGQALQEKQDAALPLSGEEIADFEQRREAVLNNPIARGFLDAREELQQVQQRVQLLVGKTLELGRIPTEEDLNEGGSCGHGCGCHH